MIIDFQAQYLPNELTAVLADAQVDLNRVVDAVAAILKQNVGPLDLVRETKGTRDFLKLRISEADEVRCGQKYFEAGEV